MNKEAFANRFAISCAESAAGTVAHAEIPTYASAFAKEAFIIHRLEYIFTATDLANLTAQGDVICAGITTTNKTTSMLAPDASKDSSVLDFINLVTMLRGTAATLFVHQNPVVKDFTNLPGGGIIAPSRPLFLAVQGLAMGATVNVYCRGWFTKVELKADEFLELVDAYRLVV